MLDRTDHKVPPMYLSLLKDFQTTGIYNWGSVVLAHLYREICNAIKDTNKEH